MWSEKVRSILSVGIEINGLGVNNWALSREQSLAAIKEFESQKIAVLGGDVYELVDGKPESNSDNWYCDQEPGEKLDKFFVRSCDHAKQYINNYKNPRGRETFFVIVAE